MSSTSKNNSYNWPYSAENMFPFIDLKYQESLIRPQLRRAFETVMDSGAYIMGPQVSALEKHLSEMTNTYALGCASGTDALILALLAYDIGPGSAVFVPSFTFAATAETVRLLGATPVFVDCMEDTFCISVESLEEAYNSIKSSSTLKPKAVISVDIFGHPASYNELGDFCKKHHLSFIADCAQSCGALYKGTSVESIADIATTSFYPPKPLGCYGDGGAVFIPKKSHHLIERIKSLRIHGQGKTRYEHILIGITGRLDTLQAAFLLEKLKLFPKEIELRNKVANRYTTGLKDLHNKGFITPFVEDQCTSVWAQYTVQVEDREKLQKYLLEFGIPSVIYYPIPLHKQKAYDKDPRSPLGLPTTDKLASRVVSLPMNPYMKVEDQEFIIEKIRTFFKT